MRRGTPLLALIPTRLHSTPGGPAWVKVLAIHKRALFDHSQKVGHPHLFTKVAFFLSPKKLYFMLFLMFFVLLLRSVTTPRLLEELARPGSTESTQMGQFSEDECSYNIDNLATHKSERALWDSWVAPVSCWSHQIWRVTGPGRPCHPVTSPTTRALALLDHVVPCHTSLHPAIHMAMCGKSVAATKSGCMIKISGEVEGGMRPC